MRDSGITTNLKSSLRFWAWDFFPGAMKVADQVENRIRAMGLTDTESAKVLRRFEEARRERRALSIGTTAVILTVICLGWWLVRKIRRGRRRIASSPLFL
jgi:hypothetical protein